jgi:hypothetical protein
VPRSNAAEPVGSSNDNGNDNGPIRSDRDRERSSTMKITVKRVEAIKATRVHLIPDAGGA